MQTEDFPPVFLVQFQHLSTINHICMHQGTWHLTTVIIRTWLLPKAWYLVLYCSIFSLCFFFQTLGHSRFYLFWSFWYFASSCCQLILAIYVKLAAQICCIVYILCEYCLWTADWWAPGSENGSGCPYKLPTHGTVLFSH